MSNAKEKLREEISQKIIKTLKELVLRSEFIKLHPEIDDITFHPGTSYNDEDNEYYNSIISPTDKSLGWVEWTSDYENEKQYNAGVALAEEFLASIDIRDFYFAFGEDVTIEVDGIERGVTP